MSQVMKPLIAGLLVTAAAIAGYGYFVDTPVPRVSGDAAVAAAVRTPQARAARPATPQDLRTAVRDRADWPLPRDAQLPGVGNSRLADNLEGWIASLPVADQERARQFAARYAPAYDVSDKAVQAWLLEMGFPSLEEFAAFDYARDAAECPAQSCGKPKVAALAADHFIAEMEQVLPAGFAGGADADALSDAQRQSAMQAYVKAGLYTDRLRQSGQVLFAAYLEARREQALGHTGRASASKLFIAACGDPRMTLDASQVSLAIALLQNAHGSACNRAGRPAFPVTDGALAATH